MSEISSYLTREQALELLTPVHPLVYRALELAAEHARAYFFEPEPNLPLDPYLFSSLVRYHTRRKLEEAPGTVPGLCLRRLANTGTLLEYRGTQIRLWKASDDGHLPPPGDSIKRRDYCYQPTLPGFEQPTGTKFAIIWEVSSNLALSEVILVCPMAVGEAFEPITEHWRIGIPHPVIAASVEVEWKPGVAEEVELEFDLEKADEHSDD